MTIPSPRSKVALVTGGAQGIGKAIALHLLKAGYRVSIADNDPEAGTETLRFLRRYGAIKFIHANVADEASVRALFAEHARYFKRLDLLVNNAGISVGGKPVESLSLADWNHTLGINLNGCFLCVREGIPLLRTSKGSIINIASTRALQSEAHTEAYSASKGALVALTHSLAVSLGPDIRVNAISPGWIDVRSWKKRSARQAPLLRPEDHKQHPVGRVGTPADIAELVLFLASPKAGFITGQNYVVDGGMTRKMIYLE